jgi:glycosyltransferase involved in cell wall biosynthesis
VFRADDPRDLAARLMALADEPARRQRLRQTAFEFVRRERDWSSIVPRYVELYERAIAATERRTARAAWARTAEGQQC